MKCPCCKGKKVSPHLGLRCSWCDGRGSVSKATARQYADTSEMLGRSGYIAGDHDLETCRQMEAEAAAIRADPRRS